MLSRLSGRTHEVVSAVSVVSAEREAQAVSVSQVTFGELSEAQIAAYVATGEPMGKRSEEHTSELQSLMRISYAVFCLKKKNAQIDKGELQHRRKHERLTTIKMNTI